MGRILRLWIGKTIIISFLLCTLLTRANISFDIRSKDIGFHHSPNPKKLSCLMKQVFPHQVTTLYYNSAVEPSIAVNPKKKSHMVAAWQQDRFSNGGSLDLGIAYSHDGGKHWHHSLVPFQNCNYGFSQRVSDCWLSYSSDGKRVYLTALVFNASDQQNTQNQQGIVAAVSHDDGEHWSIPHYLKASSHSLHHEHHHHRRLVSDKPTVTADPHIKHNAYVVWDSFDHGEHCPYGSSMHSNSYISRTTDGGKSWLHHHLLYDPYPDLFNTGLSNGNPNDCQTTNNTVVGLPNGDLLNFMTRIYAKPGVTNEEYTNDVWPYQYTAFDIACVRSIDQGKTWDTQATVIATMDANEVWTCGYNYDVAGQIISGNGVLCRTEAPLFSAAVNHHNGNLYLVWQSSQFGTLNNFLPQIALSRSRDGGVTWSVPVKVNKTPTEALNPQAFTPSVTVNHDGHLGLLYHDFRKSDVLCIDKTKTNTWFALYKETPYASGGNTGIGLEYKHEVCVSEQSYMIENGPVTDTGVMTNGDYERLVVVEDDFYGLYIQTHRGPFTPGQTVIDSHEGILILDDNRRTSPYFSKIDG